MAKRAIPGTEPMPVQGAGEVDPLGQIVGGRWRLQRRLGKGGTATVFEAHSTEGEIAAVKILDPRIAEHPQARERFRREAIAAQRIRHPDVVRILDHGDDPFGPFIAMELLDGRPLSHWARPDGFSVDMLLKVMARVLDVLGVAHDQGIIHRDIKPANIFLTRSGGVKVLDFGVARMLEALPYELRTRTGTTIGTVAYMAPEQARGSPGQIDARTDLFSLSATAFRMLAGRPVHQRNKPGELLHAMATEAAPSLAVVAPRVPRDLARVIDVGLAFRKDKRYPDARTMRADLMAVRHGRRPPYSTHLLGAASDDGGTVPDYPFEPPLDEASDTDETLHWGTPDSSPPPVDSSADATDTANHDAFDQTTVPFAGVVEDSAMGDTDDRVAGNDQRAMNTQPMGTFSERKNRNE